MRKKKWELNRSSNDCDGFSTANAGFQHASTIRLRLLLAMKMLLLTQKKDLNQNKRECEPTPLRDLTSKKKVLALTKKTRFAGSESFQT